MQSLSVIHSTRPLINVFLLLSDIDECALVDNNCSKGGANCTNNVGSFNCTCQTQYFWNGIECEGLFSVRLSCLYGNIISWSFSDKIFKPIRNSRLSGCLSGCLSLHFFDFLCVHMFVILLSFEALE